MTYKSDDDVFINCPFDNDYSMLFEAILFAIYLCGFRPRCAKEDDDGSDVRISKINRIIRECRIGIHDISRTELDVVNNLPRFNMPFELGLFLGAKQYGNKEQQGKVCVIFDKEVYRYQKYLSDIAGQDIKSHENDPHTIIKHIRNTLNTNKYGKGHIEGSTYIISQYEIYRRDKPEILNGLHLQENDLTFADETAIIEHWLSNFYQ